MPIIKSTEQTEKELIRINIEKSIAEKIRRYCEWAGVKKIDEFFKQAAEFVLSKDKDWHLHINKQESL